MAKTASDALVERLIEWGVENIFGLPGDGINGLMEALRTHQEKIRFIQVRHEEAAAFMACGYAKYSGKLGVCIATSGPGAIHLLNGLYDAKMDRAPVLAITGQTYHDLIGTSYQQEVDLLALYKDVATFNQQVMGPGHVRTLVDQACRTSIAYRTVSHITVPIDFQEANLSEAEPSMHMVPGHTSIIAKRAVVPLEEDLRQSAEVLNAGKKTVILAGQGALDATTELEELADKLAAPIVKPLLGKASVPDDSPFTTGGIGLLGTLPSELAMEECDTILMIGTSFPYMEYLPDNKKVRGVQIDHDASRIGLRFPVEAGLVGSAKETIRLLLPYLTRREDKSFLEKAQDRMKDWWKLMEEREARDTEPLRPQFVARTVNDMLSSTAIISTDSGTITTWAARSIRLKRGQMFSCSGNLATMAPGLPYAIAAKVAFPDRQSVAFVGDGGFTMLMGEFATAVKHNLPIVVVVIKNNVLGQIKWEQMVFLGNPEYGVQLHPIDFVKYAEACGGVGFHCERPDQVAPAIEAAMKAGKPALVEAVVDQFEAPMPAKVKLKQAAHMAEALARGEPNRGRIALTMFRDKLKDYSGT
jgi:pyruvate dehydrogenase (quinone)